MALRDFFGKVGRAFPAVGPAMENAVNPTTDLNALRRVGA